MSANKTSPPLSRRSRLVLLQQKRAKKASAAATATLHQKIAVIQGELESTQQVSAERERLANAEMRSLRADIVRLRNEKTAADAKRELEANDREYWERDQACVVRLEGSKFASFHEFGGCVDRTSKRLSRQGNYKLAVK